jgi:hypothetical protein
VRIFCSAKQTVLWGECRLIIQQRAEAEHGLDSPVGAENCPTSPAEFRRNRPSNDENQEIPQD